MTKEPFPGPAFYQLLFREAGVAQLLVDPGNGTILDASGAAAVILECGREEVLGHPFGQFVASPKEWRELPAWPTGTSKIELHRERGPLPVEVRVSLAKDDSSPVLHVLISPLEEEERGAAFRPDPIRVSPTQAPTVFFQFLRKADGRFLVQYISDNFQEAFRMQPNPYTRNVGKWMVEKLNAADLPKLLQAIEQSHRKLEPLEVEVRIFMEDGRERWVRITGAPARTPEGDTLWNGVVTDVNDQKLQQEMIEVSEKSFRGLVENAGEGFCVLDEDGVLVYGNRKLVAMLGLSWSDLSGKRLEKFLEPEGALFLKQAMAKGAQEGPVRFESGIHKSGQKAFFSLSPILDETGALEGFQGALVPKGESVPE